MAETGTDKDWRQMGRRTASAPHIENDPQDRELQPCWCTDYHLEVGLNLTYCPRHGREPDPELWDHAAEPFPAPAVR